LRNKEYLDTQIDDFFEGETRLIQKSNVGERLLKAFKNSHDYIYGNQGLKKSDAFWQLLFLIYCKAYDEMNSIGAFKLDGTDRRTAAGRTQIADRIRSLFEKVKTDSSYSNYFSDNDRLILNDNVLSFAAGELASCAILEAPIDAKGMAYEEITAHSLKKERGQFFTPRNVIRLMVDMINPTPDDVILDPACGSGGFLVTALDYVRKKIITRTHPKSPESDKVIQRDPSILDQVRDYVSKKVYGIDFDPDLKRAAQMNLVMNGDGAGVVMCFNSLEFPYGDSEDVTNAHELIPLGSADIVFTNPPFGTKIPVDDLRILKQFDLARKWKVEKDGSWIPTETILKRVAPEILFIEKCVRWVVPGHGRVAIVLPTGILSNKNTTYVRQWIFRNCEIIASVQLPREAFLPQVGVKASLLFLRRFSENERINTYSGEIPNYETFFAVAESVGKDKRGNPIYLRDEQGRKLTAKELKSGKESDTNIDVGILDDDLPQIAVDFRKKYGRGKGRNK
jgi:type I restriction enzyme M protein